jgi:hypothetical protein
MMLDFMITFDHIITLLQEMFSLNQNQIGLNSNYQNVMYVIQNSGISKL